MTRETVIAQTAAFFDDGRFKETLERRVAFRTESQDAASLPQLYAYLTDEIVPQLQKLGFSCQVVDNPIAGKSPFLLAERKEEGAAFTVLTYGHGDVVRGYDAQWREGLAPWKIVVEGNRWYGRGTADNKGQHTINLTALEQVLKARRGVLGYNVKIILEMGEEDGSPGLNEVCALHKDFLASDLFLASDGPRVSASRATMFLGSRGVFNFDLHLNLRDGGHHSGNWGGLLRNPGTVLAAAIHTLVDARGTIRTPLLRPADIPASVRHSVAALPVGGGPGDPEVDADWGEPGLSAAERVFAWNTLEVLGIECGSARKAIGAIPPTARAVLQLRYVVGTDLDDIEARLQRHFIQAGLPWVQVRTSIGMAATRLDPGHPCVAATARSIEATTGMAPAILPNLGGTIPNDAFSDVLGLPTVWVPHSYPACSQHAPNEHLLGSVARQGLQIMAGLFWDLGEPGRGFFPARNG